MKVRIFYCLVLLVFSLGMNAQSILNGSVVDERSKPLEGATIQVGERTTISDQQGRFELELQDGEYALSIAYIGKQLFEERIRINGPTKRTFTMISDGIILDEVMIKGIRADERTPMAYTTIDKKDIENRNLGQDIPILLNYQPSVVTTSDAGAGIGYTGIRVRGSDATRVNVTINGIPYNDSESQGTFWVNLPDFSSSLENAQLQRGVGTSTNGSGAFGASLNLLTQGVDAEAGGSINNSFGSFNSRKHTLLLNTGKLNENISLSGRLSRIKSDGYIDRATSDLTSYYLQAAYVDDKTIVKALAFGGKEITYQAWYGIDAETLMTDRTTNFAGAYTDDKGNLEFYDNEVDNYQQDHYQLLYNRTISEHLSLNIAGHYTWGRGYFEQYKEDEQLIDYGLSPVMIDSIQVAESDLIRRRWLDNDFYGFTSSLNYKKDDLNLILGGAWNQYRGDHFGEVIWARFASDGEIRERYYDNIGDKDDAHIYLKMNKVISDDWYLFADLQLRGVGYRATGVSEQPVEDDFLFFNPKLGLTYDLGESDLYASYARAAREPNRTDYENGNPVPEKLDDIELGWRMNSKDLSLNVNMYYMFYTDQLVLTGALDDVGAPIRENIGRSYRAGIEFVASIVLNDKLSVHPNFTLSRNKNIDFQFENENGLASLGDTEIGFSPSVVGANAISYQLFDDFKIELLTKYVGEQFMGNAEAPESILEDYLINDISLSYSIDADKAFKRVVFNLLVNNVLDEEYISNGYWGPGFVGYYPQAGINFLAGVNLEF